MRICPSCGAENADGRDFCACGEYLRWEKTSFVPSVNPAAAAAAPAAAAPPQQAPARVIGGPNDGSEAPTVDHSRPLVDPNATLAPSSVPSGQSSIPAVERQIQASSGEAPPGAATLLLRMPDDDGAEGKPVNVPVTPGQRVTVLGLIRNESNVVDNYELKVTGLPEGWWTITPAIAYLVPYGTGGNSEQEIQVTLHPPKSPEAQARPWPFGVVARSRAYDAQVATAPATVAVGAYQDLGAKLSPDRAAGRLKAQFKATVSNRANAPVQAVLAAEDADGECQFRFAEPSVSLNPGGIVEAPFTVFPPKQILVGRPKDRQIKVTATPVGVEDPQPPMMATYRQKAWLPWWMALVAPLLAVAIAAYVALSPKQTVVPKVIGANSVFAAQKTLVAAGMKLSPQVTQTPDPQAPPGSVIDQTPKAGTKAKKGSVVSVSVATGSSTSAVPSVVGLTPVAADAALRASNLGLGAVSPKLDPTGKIASQIPGAGQQVKAGTPVAVFLAPTLAVGKAGAAGAAAAAAAGGAGAHAGAGGSPGAAAAGGAAAGGAVVIPPASGTVMTVAQQLSQLGLVPSTKTELNSAPAGTVFGTSPGAGTSVKAGTPVTVLVSGGYPQLAYDDGKTVHAIDANSKSTLSGVPGGALSGSQPTWSKDGTHLVYSQGGQLWLFDATHPSTAPLDLTAPGSADYDPGLAPTTKSNIVAFIDAHNGTRLCFATIGPNTLNPDCTSHPGFTLGHPVQWSPDGTAILVFGTKAGDPNTFGLIEFASNVPFSSHAADWGQGQVVTPMPGSGQGVIAGAFSPDGSRVALVSNIGTFDFHVFVAARNDLGMQHSSALPVAACQVAWRPDGQLLAVMRADSACRQSTGDIETIALSNPGTSTTVATQAADPVWQPVH